MRSIKNSFIQNIIFLFLIITTNDCLSSDVAKAKHLFNDPNKLRSYIFYEYREKNFEVPLLRRFSNKPIAWNDVMTNHQGNGSTLMNFLTYYYGTITGVDNYNPFNYLNLEDNIETLKELVPLMIKHGADINQEEKINIIPACFDCFKKNKHQCKLKNKDKNAHNNKLEEHTIYINGSPICSKNYCSRRDKMNRNYSGVFEVYKNPLWRIIEDRKKFDCINDLMKLFIKNKADINYKNILVEWCGKIPSENKQINDTESLLEYAVSERLNIDIIKLLISKGAQISIKKPKTIMIDQQEFEVRKKIFPFFLFDNIDYLYTLEKKIL